MPEKDFVDSVLEAWKRERPDLDPSPMGVLARIARLQSHLDRLLGEVFAEFELGRGEFDLLATLRRSGEPFRLSPKALTGRLMLSPAAMTNRLDNLERRGLIRRLPDPEDRRGLLIELTRDGRRVIDQAVTRHLANEEQILGVFTKQERRELAALLKKLLLSVET